MYTLTCILIYSHTHAHILPQSYLFTPWNTPSYRPTIAYIHTLKSHTLSYRYTIIVTQMHSHTNFYTDIIIYTRAQHGYVRQPHILMHPHWTQDCIDMCSHLCTHTPSHRYSHTRAHTTVSPQKSKSLRKSPSRNISTDIHPGLVQGWRAQWQLPEMLLEADLRSWWLGIRLPWIAPHI